jgi:hypothetical protein
LEAVTRRMSVVVSRDSFDECEEPEEELEERLRAMAATLPGEARSVHRAPRAGGAQVQARGAVAERATHR